MHVKPWEWMVKPTPQEEWIEGKGLLSWLSFFSVAIGAGMYFVAVLVNYPWAMVAGYLVCLVVGGGTKVLDLGQPKRAWRMLLNYDGEGGLLNAVLLLFTSPKRFFKMFLNSGWRTSWISRGMYFIGLFAIMGLVHIILAFVVANGATGIAALGSATGVFAIIMAVVSVLVTIYAGLLIGYVRAIPLWGSALMPIFFVASGFLGGAALALAGRINNNAAVLPWIHILVLIYVAVVMVYLWNAWNQSGTSRYSVQQMMKGGGMLSVIFYLGVVVLGILLPVAIVIVSMTVGAGVILLALAIAGVIIGDLSMRYLIMKCGVYTPLITTSPY